MSIDKPERFMLNVADVSQSTARNSQPVTVLSARIPTWGAEVGV
jgi:hypothetical protein